MLLMHEAERSSESGKVSGLGVPLEAHAGFCLFFLFCSSFKS